MLNLFGFSENSKDIIFLNYHIIPENVFFNNPLIFCFSFKFLLFTKHLNNQAFSLLNPEGLHVKRK
jgi:hypothetical protein